MSRYIRTFIRSFVLCRERDQGGWIRRKGGREFPHFARREFKTRFAGKSTTRDEFSRYRPSKSAPLNVFPSYGNKLYGYLNIGKCIVV